MQFGKILGYFWNASWGAVAELADALDLGSSSFGSAGSIPVSPTRFRTFSRHDIGEQCETLRPKMPFSGGIAPIKMHLGGPRGAET